MKKPSLSFRNKIFLMTIPIVFFVVFMVTGAYSLLNSWEQKKQIREASNVLSKNLNKQLLPFVATGNYAPLSAFLQSLTSDKNVLYAMIENKDGKVVATSERAVSFRDKMSRARNTYSSSIYTVQKYFSPATDRWVMEAQVPLFEGTTNTVPL